MQSSDEEMRSEFSTSDAEDIKSESVRSEEEDEISGDDRIDNKDEITDPEFLVGLYSVARGLGAGLGDAEFERFKGMVEERGTPEQKRQMRENESCDADEEDIKSQSVMSEEEDEMSEDDKNFIDDEHESKDPEFVEFVRCIARGLGEEFQYKPEFRGEAFETFKRIVTNHGTFVQKRQMRENDLCDAAAAFSGVPDWESEF